MELLSSPELWIAFFSLLLLEIVLGIESGQQGVTLPTPERKP